MLVLESGDKIRGDAATASEVDFCIFGLDGTSLAELANGQLADSTGDLFTADSTDTVTTITLVNTGAAANACNLFFYDGTNSRRIIPKDLSLGSGYSLHTDGKSFSVVDTSGCILYSVTTAGAANTALSNLSSVAVSESLISDTDETDDLGSSDKEWKDLYIDGTAYIDNIEIASGETITGDGTDLTLASGGDIALTATGDVNIPANVGITFGDDGEKIEGDATDLTISGNNINLTAAADVNIPTNIGLTFATTEKIESDGTDLSVTVGAGGDINIGADIGVTFGDDGEKIEGNGTDLTISGNNINLTATADVVVPANVGVTFGSGEKIEGNDTDLTLTSGSDITLAATNDVNIPVNVGLRLGDGGENIETDNTDLTITSGGELLLTAASDVVIPVNIGLHLGDGAEKLESDNTDLTINSGSDINLTATNDINVPANIGMTFGDDGEKIEGDGTDLTVSSSGVLNLNATGGVQLIEDMPLLMDQTLTADTNYCGICEKGTAGATLAVGDICYLQTADTRWELANADDGATGHNFKLGICVQAAGSDGSATTMLLYGKVRAATLPALTVGAPVYLGTTAGDVQTAAPSGSTDIVRIVGYGNTAEDLFFCPENDWITLT